MNTKVLYIEDEPFLGKIVNETLHLQGFEMMWIADGALVMESLSVFQPHVCVLDIMLPNIDGYTLCREIRAKYPELPVIFLTALCETSDLVKGFEAGGSDYIKKPFSMEELIVRIHNILSLTSSQRINEECIIGRYRLFLSRYELVSPTVVQKLSVREMEVLAILTNNINKVVERRDLLIKVWGDDSFFNSRTLDVYIRKLRTLLMEDSDIEIVTLKGKGYLFLIK